MAALLNPTAGLALALAVPVLPLGNASLGLAVVYSVFAAVWLALFWRDPRSSFLFLAGPVLAAFQALPLVTVAFSDVRGVLRRGALAAAATLCAAAVAGIRTGESLDLHATSSPREAFACAHGLSGGEPRGLDRGRCPRGGDVCRPVRAKPRPVGNRRLGLRISRRRAHRDGRRRRRVSVRPLGLARRRDSRAAAAPYALDGPLRAKCPR